MIKKLNLLFLLLIPACTNYSDITESTELLIAKGYHSIEYRYTANNDDVNIKSLCDYSTTIVFAAKDSKNQSKTLAVCVDTKEIHLLSQVLY